MPHGTRSRRSKTLPIAEERTGWPLRQGIGLARPAMHSLDPEPLHLLVEALSRDSQLSGSDRAAVLGGVKRVSTLPS